MGFVNFQVLARNREPRCITLQLFIKTLNFCKELFRFPEHPPLAPPKRRCFDVSPPRSAQRAGWVPTLPDKPPT